MCLPLASLVAGLPVSFFFFVFFILYLFLLSVNSGWLLFRLLVWALGIREVLGEEGGGVSEECGLSFLCLYVYRV